MSKELEQALELVTYDMVKSLTYSDELPLTNGFIIRHYDEEVSFIKVEEYGVYEEIEISFRLDVREEMEIVDGEQTWLYF